MPEPRLPGGVATAVGSLPGDDIVEAVEIVFGELPDFPHLPELPGRGAGADLLGRGAALLTDMPVELYAGTWQTASRAGRDWRRARDFLRRDLDALTDRVSEHDGFVKLSAAGPWTLAAGLHRPMGGAMLADPGASRELSESLADGLRNLLDEVAERMPRATPVLQLDEPSLPAVLAGTVPTVSGWSRYPAVETPTATEALRAVVEAVSAPVVIHCCAPDVPWDVMRGCGADGVSLDVALLADSGTGNLDAFAEAMEADMTLLAGVVDTGDEPLTSAREAASEITELWSRIGLTRRRLAAQVCVTPRCGLAGVAPSRAREALRQCREAARRVVD